MSVEVELLNYTAYKNDEGYLVRVFGYVNGKLSTWRLNTYVMSRSGDFRLNRGARCVFSRAMANSAGCPTYNYTSPISEGDILTEIPYEEFYRSIVFERQENVAVMLRVLSQSVKIYVLTPRLVHSEDINLQSYTKAMTLDPQFVGKMLPTFEPVNVRIDDVEQYHKVAIQLTYEGNVKPVLVFASTTKRVSKLLHVGIYYLSDVAPGVIHMDTGDDYDDDEEDDYDDDDD